MTHKEKDIWAMFNELNSMLYEVMGDFNKAWAENIELKKEVDWFKKYTDALVEHKDMVCLPADLKNLRESNAALATENQELKKQVDTLNEVITQSWFTDVEEKDKQIEYLLKRVQELSGPEPTDEELTSLFMDKQVNPKDIEFDGDKLVASVEEAASKLKSLEEHNNSKLNGIYSKNALKNGIGIACPKCGDELYYTNPDMMLTSNPPKQSVHCKNCLHMDYVY